MLHMIFLHEPCRGNNIEIASCYNSIMGQVKFCLRSVEIAIDSEITYNQGGWDFFQNAL